MFRNFLLKIKPFVAVLLLAALIVPLLAAPKKAEAQMPVTIVGGWLPQLDLIVGTTAAETKQTFFQWTQTFVLEALKKRVLDLMVDEILQWVKGGDEPKFITDWEGFLSDAGAIAADEFAKKLGVTDICAPFKLQLQIAFPTQGSRSAPLRTPLSCTLDDIVGNIDDFYNDFENGGWLAYQEAWEPQNNIFGAYIIAKSAELATIESAQEAAKNEGLSSGGFLSTKSCPESSTSNGPDIDKDGIKGDIARECSITTPGSVIGELTKRAVGADFDFIVNSTQLASYVASIADALFNRLIREGVSGLQGLTTKNAPSTSDGAIPAGASGCAAFPAGSASRITCDRYVGSNANNFGVMRDALFVDLKETKDSLIELRAAIAEQKGIADTLQAFITTESATKSSQCISSALSPYFSPATLARVTEYADSVTARLQKIDGYLAEINALDARFEALTPETWADFTVLAAELDEKLPAFAVEEDEIEEAQIQAVETRSAYNRIKNDIDRCFF